VLAKAVATSEKPFALATVVVPLRLAIMFCQTVFIGEHPATVLTIGVLRALGPMLLQLTLGKEIPITADVVLWRILLVTLEGALAKEVTIATIAVTWHGSTLVRA